MSVVDFLWPAYTALMGAIIAWLIGWVKRLSDKKASEKSDDEKMLKALTSGMQYLLLKELKAYHRILVNCGTIGIEEWGDVETIYQIYMQLGGNHIGTAIYMKIKGAVFTEDRDG